MMKSLAACAAALLLAACASGPPPGGALVPAPGIQAAAAQHTILVATTRVPVAGGDMFSADRAGTGTIAHAEITVAIPPTHEPGFIQWPGKAPGDPALSFTTAARDYLAQSAFDSALDAALTTRAPADRDVLLFVHGYNTRFDEAVYRLAQFVHDGRYPGVPALFSFPSEGSLLGYVYDRDSAMASRDGLEETIRQIAAAPHLRRLNILCHSVGCLLTMETLRQAKIGGDATFGGKLGDIVMASPDIDVAVFRSQLRRLGGRMPAPTTIFIATDDGALGIASAISGDQPRLGDYDQAASFADTGITVVDLTRLEAGATGMMGHDKVFASEGIAQIVGAEIGRGNRFGKNAPRAGDRIASQIRQLGSSLGESVRSVLSVITLSPGR
jgi:esterase/lipase superfamily enzyme